MKFNIVSTSTYYVQEILNKYPELKDITKIETKRYKYLVSQDILIAEDVGFDSIIPKLITIMCHQHREPMFVVTPSEEKEFDYIIELYDNYRE